jgi:mannose-6-phosphate isomerase-like protein (cupin superfamily)
MEKHEKTWGWEHWFANTARYCGKLIFVRYKEWSSKGNYHYHKLKDETFFVISGILQLDWVDHDGEFHTTILKQHESMRVGTLTKHRFTALNEEGCEFVEASTTHREEDSYRCSWDGKEWKNINS